MTIGIVESLSVPDAEFLAQVFLTPIVSPVLVSTRLPSPVATSGTVGAHVRVEGAGVTKCDPLTPNAMFDISVMTHCYSPVEVEASDLSGKVLAAVSGARGTIVAGWYVVRVMGASGSQRLSDPMVNLIRYRGLFTWTVTTSI